MLTALALRSAQAIQAAAAAGGPFPVRGCIHGYVWTVVEFKARQLNLNQNTAADATRPPAPPQYSRVEPDASVAPLPRFLLRLVLEDGSASAAALMAHDAVASLLGRATPAALLADLAPEAEPAVREDVRARIGALRAALQGGVGRLDVEVAAPGEPLSLLRIHAAAEEGGEGALAKGWALLQRLRRNGALARH
jgi:hypothetical protein